MSIVRLNGQNFKMQRAKKSFRTHLNDFMMQYPSQKGLYLNFKFFFIVLNI